MRDWVERVTGARVLEMTPLPGGAGHRRYYRLRLEDGGTRVLMHAKPEDEAILPPALRGAGKRRDFQVVTELLGLHRIPVPAIEAVDAPKRWLLLEDLGDVRLADLEPAELAARRHEAASLLARIHAIPRGSGIPFNRAFDAAWIRFELEHFLAYGVPERLRPELRSPVEEIVEAVASLPRVLCVRDYQSHNLMIDPRGRLRLIDYQDALLAPPELDLASFLHDSYLQAGAPERATLLSSYEASGDIRIDPASLALLVVQRKCKDFARFRYLVEVKGDARFGPYRARARQAVVDSLSTAPLTPACRRAIQTAMEGATT